MGTAATWTWFGASVRGRAHARSGAENQDAWFGREGPYGSLVAVCDGLGSRPHSARGAAAACRAVLDALRHWVDAQAPPELLLRLIHNLWAVRVCPQTPDDSATTCLLAAAMPSGRLVLAQLGDGMILLRLPGETSAPLAPSRGGFGNETTGLGVAKNLSEWVVRVVEEAPPGTAVMLATDGVADDLLPERLDGFLDHLLADYAPLSARRRAAVLARDLRNWPTPGHTDDKTLALLWSRSGEEKP